MLYPYPLNIRSRRILLYALALLSIKTGSRTTLDLDKKKQDTRIIKILSFVLTDALQQDLWKISHSYLRGLAIKEFLAERTLAVLMISGNSIARSSEIFTFLALL